MHVCINFPSFLTKGSEFGGLPLACGRLLHAHKRSRRCREDDTGFVPHTLCGSHRMAGMDVSDELGGLRPNLWCLETVGDKTWMFWAPGGRSQGLEHGMQELQWSLVCTFLPKSKTETVNRRQSRHTPRNRSGKNHLRRNRQNPRICSFNVHVFGRSENPKQ